MSVKLVQIDGPPITEHRPLLLSTVNHNVNPYSLANYHYTSVSNMSTTIYQRNEKLCCKFIYTLVRLSTLTAPKKASTMNKLSLSQRVGLMQSGVVLYLLQGKT
ncbi:hypothetical protein EWB00_003036 [Schistosoma japonicum]|uniref:Uncharacterized protein n=1 Tax=Schistosoma japonicum TaxID=6182 RepID=A0A4Z2DA89_SCHJA|nr:hypothetical protein EWB00_003036 [Schistosoma japonicum]